MVMEFKSSLRHSKILHYSSHLIHPFSERTFNLKGCSHNTMEVSLSMERMVRRIEEELLKIITSIKRKEEPRGRRSFPEGNIRELRELCKAKGM